MTTSLDMIILVEFLIKYIFIKINFLKIIHKYKNKIKFYM